MSSLTTTPKATDSQALHTHQNAAPRLRQLAYFYEPFWRSGAAAAIKTLLLFFDGVALTVPQYLRGVPLAADPAFAETLDEQGLLVRLSPEYLIDRETAHTAAQLLVKLAVSNAAESLDRAQPYQAVSHSRRDGTTDPLLTDTVLTELVQQGLATPSRDGRAVSLHPIVRARALVALPQILRRSAERAGYALQPITTHPQQAHALLDFTALAPLPTARHRVARELEQVAPDLATVPLTEVLAFRTEHAEALHAYVYELRKLLRDWALTAAQDRDEAMLDRREALAQAADDLRRTARTTWYRPLGWCALGIAGSAAPRNDVRLGDDESNASTMFLGLGRTSDPGSVYTYLFEAPHHLMRSCTSA